MNKNQILTLILGISITIVISLLVSFELLPKNSIIISAIVLGIVLTILIRKQKENSNEKGLPETERKNTKDSTRFYYLIITIRIFSLFSALLTLIIISDILLPASVVDSAIVYYKNINESKNGKTYYIYASGKYKYKESVNKDFYDKIQIRDTLKVYLTKNFLEWKKAELIKNNNIALTLQGSDIYYMGTFGLAFLIPLFSFLDYRKWLKKIYYWIPSGILIILSLVFWTLLILKWTGSIEKF